MAPVPPPPKAAVAFAATAMLVNTPRENIGTILWVDGLQRNICNPVPTRAEASDKQRIGTWQRTLSVSFTPQRRKFPASTYPRWLMPPVSWPRLGRVTRRRFEGGALNDQGRRADTARRNMERREAPGPCAKGLARRRRGARGGCANPAPRGPRQSPGAYASQAYPTCAFDMPDPGYTRDRGAPSSFSEGGKREAGLPRAFQEQGLRSVGFFSASS